MFIGLPTLMFSGPFTPLLLDQYTGATAIYSLRLLKVMTTNKCIKVRRSSDNTTQDIGYTANRVLDETALTTFTGAGDGYVDTWYDQSGNGLDAVQLTTTSQPRIVNGGVVDELNGKPCLYFDGGDFMPCVNSSLYCAVGGQWSCFGVAKWDDGLSRLLWDSDDNNTPFRLGQFIRSVVGVAFRSYAFNNTGAAYSDDSDGLSTSQILAYSIRTSTTVELYVNNSSNGSSATSGTPKTGTTTKTTIGAFNGGSANLFFGSVQEIIHFGTTSDYRIPISNNINAFYTIY